MTQQDVDEVVRLIRLHDSDDGHHARAFFTDYFAPGGPAEQPGHRHLVYVDPTERRVVGVTGYGPGDAEAKGVYWLGWVYVNPYFQGRGIGGALMVKVLDEVRALGGRKVYVDTSSLPSYQSAVRFYERYGFRLEGRLRDYYAPGEDCLLLGRDL